MGGNCCVSWLKNLNVGLILDAVLRYVTTALSLWDFSVGNSGLVSLGKPAATESCYPTYSLCWVFKSFHNPPNSDMNYRVFNMHTDVCMRFSLGGCTDTIRESAVKVDSGRKILCHSGESNLCQRHGGLMLYQLSYIPTSSKGFQILRVCNCCWALPVYGPGLIKRKKQMTLFQKRSYNYPVLFLLLDDGPTFIFSQSLFQLLVSLYERETESERESERETEYKAYPAEAQLQQIEGGQKSIVYNESLVRQ